MEKDLLIKEISIIMESYESVSGYVNSSRIPFDIVVFQFKSISKALSYLEELGRLCDHDISKDVLALQNQNIHIKAEVTNNSLAQLGVIYALPQRNLIGFNLKFTDQKKRFLSLIVKVNRI